MRKVVVLILFIGQILLTFNSYISVLNEKNLHTLKVVEVRSTSGILKVVYDSFLEVLRTFIELGFLFSDLSTKEKQKKEDDCCNSQYVIFSTFKLLSFNENIKRLFGKIETFWLFNKESLVYGLLTNKSFFISFLTFLFLYLYRLRCVFLKPRASISNVIYYLGVVNVNPNWGFGGNPKIPIRVFLFYKEVGL